MSDEGPEIGAPRATGEKGVGDCNGGVVVVVKVDFGDRTRSGRCLSPRSSCEPGSLLLSIPLSP